MPRRITDGLGEQWKIAENGYRMHSCCAHTHTAIDAALTLRAALASPGWCHAHRRDRHRDVRPWIRDCEGAAIREHRTRRNSAWPTLLPTALLEGRVELDQFADSALQSRTVFATRPSPITPRA